MENNEKLVAERVARGVAKLDEFLPGWREILDWEGFDMASCDDCILGQIYGDYGNGKIALKIRDEPGSEYGFDRNYFESNYLRGPDYADYQAEWMKQRPAA